MGKSITVQTKWVFSKTLYRVAVHVSEGFMFSSMLIFLLQIPEFDNLYLDMNGIVHVCSHPNDGDPHFRITEEKIFADIFHYIEVSDSK